MPKLLVLSPTAVRVCLVLLLPLTFAQAQNITLPSSLVAPGETLRVLKSGMAMTEGPAADSAGNLFFTVPFKDTIWRISPTGDATVFDNASNGANGLVFDEHDRLIACEKQRLTRLEADGSHTILATFDGWANDLSLAPDGGIYFTQPAWNKPESSYVFYRAPAGGLQILQTKVPGFPNGIEFVAEKNRLYIAYSQRNVVMAYTLDSDNAFVDSTQFATVTTPDGFALDEHGNLWITSNSTARVEVFDSTGQSLGHIAVSGQSNIQNCAFGGPGNGTLYIAGANAVMALQTAVRGRSTRGDGGLGARRGGHGSIQRNSRPGVRQVRYADGFGVCVSQPDARAVSLTLYTVRGRLLSGPVTCASSRMGYVRPRSGRAASGCHVLVVHAGTHTEHSAAIGLGAGR